MSAPYNRFAGRDLARLQALSDGVFAVAMTLLVLDLRAPLGDVHSNRGLWHALSALGPNLAAYLLSFTMLGTFWLAQHTLLNLCARSDRNLAWLQVGFLFVVTLLPFSATILAEHVTIALAVGVYWVNLALLGIALAAASGYIRKSTLLQESAAAQVRIFQRRTLIAQLAYGIAALTCLLSTYASIGALAAVQLYFILSPQIPGLDRLLQPRNSEQ